MKKLISPVTSLGPMFQGWLSPAIRVGDFVFLSGLIGCDPETGKILSSGTEGQVRRIFEAMESVLRVHGASLKDVVKMTMYYTDRKEQSPIVDRIRREIWKTNPPATTGVGITELAQGAEVEIDAIAVLGTTPTTVHRQASATSRKKKPTSS